MTTLRTSTIVFGLWFAAVAVEPAFATPRAANGRHLRSHDRIVGLDSSGVPAVRRARPGRLRWLRIGGEILRLLAADINGDGHPDLVAGGKQHGLLAWLNNGRGRFTPRAPQPPPDPWHFSLGFRASALPRAHREAMQADALPLQPGPDPPLAQLIPLAIVARAESWPIRLHSVSRSSPRAPPASL